MLVVLLKFIPENVFLLYTCIKIKIISIYNKCISNLKNVNIIIGYTSGSPGADPGFVVRGGGEGRE